MHLTVLEKYFFLISNLIADFEIHVPALLP